MNEVNSQSALMALLINHLADSFGNNAILKGGMALRLLGCPRHTNDLDYTFIPYSSKNDIAEPVLNALSHLPGLNTHHSFSSKCLRYLCEYNKIQVQLEINVAESCEDQPLSSAQFSGEHNLTGRIIRIMRLNVALAHKIAAWNERGLLKDLYDCFYLVEILGIKPHIRALNVRLQSVHSRVGSKSKPLSMSMDDLKKKLSMVIEALTEEWVDEELRDYFSPIELPGMGLRIRRGLIKLIDLLQ